MIKKILSLGFNLAIICAIAAGALAYTYAKTKDRIAQQIWEEQIKAAKAVLPEVKKNEDFKEMKELTEAVRAKVALVDKIFEGYADGQLIGYAVQVLPRGYGGPITLMVGLGLDGRVSDIKVVDHRETPGLGSGIEDPAWAGQFQGKKSGDSLKVNKDFDALSGATISSKGIARGVKDALEAYTLFGGGA